MDCELSNPPFSFHYAADLLSSFRQVFQFLEFRIQGGLAKILYVSLSEFTLGMNTVVMGLQKVFRVRKI